MKQLWLECKVLKDGISALPLRVCSTNPGLQRDGGLPFGLGGLFGFATHAFCSDSNEKVESGSKMIYKYE